MNGTVAQYSFSLSADGVNWGPTAAAGTFGSDTEENASTGQECDHTVDSPSVFFTWWANSSMPDGQANDSALMVQHWR
jgi:hypothetical protein